MKKFLLLMICTLFPIFASAQEPYAVMIDGNTAIEFRYDNEKAARGGMDIGPFNNWEERPWNSLSTSIISVIFDESFANCTSITSTAWWFASMQYLDYIGGLEYLNTSNVTDMSSMFTECQKLEEIDVSHFNTSNVTSMFQMFAGCQSVKSLDVTHFNTENVNDMRWMFGRCSSLTNLDLSSFNTANVTNMGEMFNGDESFTSLDISSFNTSNVTIMWLMFGSCTNLKTIYVGDGWSTANVTESANMFEGCTSLVGESGTTYDSSHTDAEYARVDMGSSPGYFTYKNGGGSSEEAQYWMELQSMLQYADELYGRARDNSNVEQWMLEELSMMIDRGSNMYDEHTADEEEVRHMIEELNWICWEIEEAMNRNPDEPSGEAEPYAVISDEGRVVTFYYDDQKDNRDGIDIFSYDENATSKVVQNPYSSATTAIIDVSFANYRPTDTSWWFFGCKNLSSISGLENLNTSNVTDMGFMFRECSNITELNVGHFDTSNVTSFTAMFMDCTNLRSIDVSNFNTASATSMVGMFGYCTNLTFIDVSKFNTSNVVYLNTMFEGCSGLTSLDLSSFNTSNVKTMQAIFQQCSNLTTIYVGDGWNTANVTDVTDSWYMFEGCERLVGGRGTTYDPDHIDVEYAHIDGGPDNPGYLTDKNGGESEAYFDGLTAWVYGDATLDDAFEEVGRESAVQTIAAIVWEGTGALTAEQMQGITNPNLLVYVTEASKAPAGVQNVIVNGTAAQIVLTDASGNNNFFCPEPFTAQSISYTRNFSQTTEIGVSRGWETIALPFNVQSISHGSHGALVPFGGGNGGYPFWLHQLQDNGLTPVTAMEANTPYLICMPNNTVYPSAYNQAGSVTFASSNVTVPRTEPREAFGANVILMPAFQNQAAGPDIFTLNVGAARDSYAEGSVFISNYSDVRPFQAYVHHSNQARGTDEIQFIPLTSIGGGDDTTAIMEIIQPAANGTGDWYSLDGRKLSSKPTQKGVYIQNGKKIVIK